MAFLNDAARARTLRNLARIVQAALVFASATSFGTGLEMDADQVKAVFLLKLAKFVDWPEGTFASPRAPLSVCVIGSNAFADLLEGVIKDSPGIGREFAVRRLLSASEGRKCQIMYFAASERRRVRAALTTLGGPPGAASGILTAGETEGFAIQGCVIDFWMESDKVRFEINMEAAARAQIRISSKVLSLAARMVKE